MDGQGTLLTECPGQSLTRNTPDAIQSNDG